MLEEYLESKRKGGKSDSDIIKDATGKAGMFMIFTFLIMVILVMFLIIIFNDSGKISEFENALRNLLGAVYPKLAETAPVPATGEL